ncbi:hypothetical protein E2C01_061427 [Portunus trituberculatus]|uniref:Uncharacterized protein n=1 Tax=Portunus trituberculatus TaxID=210409 RepID=A0A5B7HAW8_PORTR|nr:hypothetical protein [Portunus trituberculatus]
MALEASWADGELLPPSEEEVEVWEGEEEALEEAVEHVLCVSSCLSCTVVVAVSPVFFAPSSCLSAPFMCSTPSPGCGWVISSRPSTEASQWDSPCVSVAGGYDFPSSLMEGDSELRKTSLVVLDAHSSFYYYSCCSAFSVDSRASAEQLVTTTSAAVTQPELAPCRPLTHLVKTWGECDCDFSKTFEASHSLAQTRTRHTDFHALPSETRPSFTATLGKATDHSRQPTRGRGSTSITESRVQRGSGSGRAWAGGCARHEVESETERDAGDGEAEG